MVFEKTKELYDNGNLIAEVFKDSYLVALLSSSHAYVKNRHYGLPKTRNFIALNPEEFSDVSDAVEEWKEVKDSLWGRRAHGSSMTGHTSTTFYPPHETEGINIKKGQSNDHIGVGQLEQQLQKGALSFTFERFCLGISRDGQATLLDGHQVPLLEQVFALYHKRNGIYTQIEDSLDLEGSLAWDEF
jgi:hypothetical protein